MITIVRSKERSRFVIAARWIFRMCDNALEALPPELLDPPGDRKTVRLISILDYSRFWFKGCDVTTTKKSGYNATRIRDSPPSIDDSFDSCRKIFFVNENEI